MVSVNRLKDFQTAKGTFRVRNTLPKLLTALESITGFTRFQTAKLFDLLLQKAQELKNWPYHWKH